MFPNWLRWSTEARACDGYVAPCIFFFSSFKFHLVQSKGKQPHCVMRPPDGTASPPVHSFISAPLRQTSDCSLEKVFFREKKIQFLSAEHFDYTCWKGSFRYILYSVVVKAWLAHKNRFGFKFAWCGEKPHKPELGLHSDSVWRLEVWPHVDISGRRFAL